MGIVRFALRFPHTFYVLAALILFLGFAAIRGMPTDIFPEIRIPVVTVIWQYTGLTTPEMEQRVSTYSQYSISANVNGIKNMEAQTLNGLSIQKLYFQPDVNLDLAIAQVVSATNSIRALMPPGIEPPIIVQFNASSVPVLQLSLNSDNLNEQQLYDFGIYRVRQELREMVAEAARMPGPESDRTAHIGAAYMRFVARRPAVARLMFGGQLPNREKFPSLGEAADAVGTEIGNALADPALGMAVWSAVHGLAMLVLENVIDLGQRRSGLSVLPSRAEILLRSLFSAPRD